MTTPQANPSPTPRSAYEAESGPFEAKYGLPAEVRFCRRCLISNQRPNSSVEFKNRPGDRKATIAFDAEGVCDACRVAERKHAEVDWSERDRELRELCDRHRRSDGQYDCLVPGSGGKDSFYAAHVLKYKYGMNPLTVTWAPNLYTDWGWKNQQAWIHSGMDNILVTPSGKTHRLLTRLSVERLFHPFSMFIVGQKSLAPKMAALHDIPLVFYGENEAEYGNPISDTGTARRSWQYFAAENEADIFLGGASLAELKERFRLRPAELLPYLPVNPERLDEKRIEVHYLGYYLKWHPQSCYYYAVEHGGFQASPERTPGTYSKYNSIDDKIDDLHYYTTFIKFGIGRATYDAAQEVRSGDITREEGVALVKRFDGEFPARFIDELYAYLSVDEKTYGPVAAEFARPAMDAEFFAELTDRFRSPHLWRLKDGKWSLRAAVWMEDGGDQAGTAGAWQGNPRG